MNSLSILSSMPEGYAIEESAGGVLVLEEQSRELLRAAGLGPESGPSTTQSDLVGRRPLREIMTPNGSFVVRSYIHGGLARHLTGERFADPERPFRELLTSHALSQLGFSTPRIVAARARRAPLRGWYLDLISKRVHGLMSLTRLISSVELGTASLPLLKRVAEAVGKLVRSFHDHRFVHADLTTENILVEEASLLSNEPRFCTLDLDQSSFVAGLSDTDRRDNLRRLYRCLLRRTTHAHTIPVTGLCARFMRGYDSVCESRRADWRAIARASKRSRLPHLLGWLLERSRGDSRAMTEKGITRLPTQSSD